DAEAVLLERGIEMDSSEIPLECGLFLRRRVPPEADQRADPAVRHTQEHPASLTAERVRRLAHSCGVLSLDAGQAAFFQLVKDVGRRRKGHAKPWPVSENDLPNFLGVIEEGSDALDALARDGQS